MIHHIYQLLELQTKAAQTVASYKKQLEKADADIGKLRQEVVEVVQLRIRISPSLSSDYYIKFQYFIISVLVNNQYSVMYVSYFRFLF